MSARILLADIETSYTVARIWSLRDLNVGINQIKEDPRMIAIGAQWYGEKSVRFFSEYHHTRKEMLEQTHELLTEADVVVTYNGDRFDLKWWNGEFFREGITPPSPFKSLDLYKVGGKNFRFVSHKLQYVSTAAGLEGKLSHTGFQLWIDCLEGDEETRRRAWGLMQRYCKQDVRLLGPLLDRMRPWITGAINFAIYEPNDGRPRCQKCGAVSLTRQGWAVTTSGRFQQYQCQACGGWTRDTRSVERVSTTGVAR